MLGGTHVVAGNKAKAGSGGDLTGRLSDWQSGHLKTQVGILGYAYGGWFLVAFLGPTA